MNRNAVLVFKKRTGTPFRCVPVQFEPCTELALSQSMCESSGMVWDTDWSPATDREWNSQTVAYRTTCFRSCSRRTLAHT